MHVNGRPQRTIWLSPDDPSIVQIIDQRALPHEWIVADLRTYRDGVTAIADMLVRGAPLIGATTAWSLYLAALEDPSRAFLHAAGKDLLAARPTAVNLRWAVELMRAGWTPEDTASVYRRLAEQVCDDDVAISRGIGEHGVGLIEAIAREKRAGPVNILTHCNAGWLATVDWGTATAPIYVARERGIDVHVWVDETRPRNQGAHLTAWELGQEGVPHTVIVDNAGGHLMQHGMVDLCITGTDRTARSGDVCNKIGTYLKALAASDNNVPFYVALPSTTIDWTLRDGVAEIPIEERDAGEVTHVQGRSRHGVHTVQITPERSPAANYAFDVTPARLVTGLITERGVCPASEAGLLELFPDHA
jgi:methylthioribose-1-phosphate isomerase